MREVTLVFKVIIKADQKVIFDYVSNWEKQSEWILFTTVNKISAAPDQVGTKLLATTKFAAIKLIDTMIVTEWQPFEKITVEHTGRIILGKGVFKIHSISENNCEFTWEEITPIPFGIFGQIGLLIVKPWMKLLFGISLKRLKSNIEIL
jgi:hypothetical protein